MPKKTTFFVLVIFSCIASAGDKAMSQDVFVAGPENHGLRLGLSIKTIRHNDVDVHTVNLSILNCGETDLTLKALWPYENLKGDYCEFLKSQIQIITFPKVLPLMEQTAGPTRKSPQPTLKLEAGAHKSIEWKGYNRFLKPRETFDFYNTTPHLPSKGLYGVRGEAIVVDGQKKRILLVTNEVQVTIGGSINTPKWATGEVVDVYTDSIVVINLGSLHGIGKEDRFVLGVGMVPKWNFFPVKVGVEYTEGKVIPVNNHEKNLANLPSIGCRASLVPDDID